MVDAFVERVAGVFEVLGRGAVRVGVLQLSQGGVD